jgi:hypothetical protein
MKCVCIKATGAKNEEMKILFFLIVVGIRLLLYCRREVETYFDGKGLGAYKPLVKFTTTKEVPEKKSFHWVPEIPVWRRSKNPSSPLYPFFFFLSIFRV